MTLRSELSYHRRFAAIYTPVAQGTEHVATDHGVGSSNLSRRAIKIFMRGDKNMLRTADYYRLRADRLEKRKNASENKRIIQKLMRKVRQLEKSEDHLA